MRAPVEYIPGFVSDPEQALKELQALDYERRDTTPRSEYFASDHPFPYAYGRGRGRRTYHPRPWSPRLLDMRAKIEDHVKAVMDVVFCNRYLDQSDHLGWHADDSPEMDDERPIVTISFGAVREIWFRTLAGFRCKDCGVERETMPDEADRSAHHKMSCFTGTYRQVYGGEVEKLTLEPGAACIMLPHMQETWEHRIPRSSSACGERVSAVYRGYVPVIDPGA